MIHVASPLVLVAALFAMGCGSSNAPSEPARVVASAAPVDLNGTFLRDAQGRVSVIVTLKTSKDAGPAVAELRRRGFVVDPNTERFLREGTEIFAVTGHIPEDQLKGLGTVPGVEHVGLDHEVHLAPPGSPQ